MKFFVLQLVALLMVASATCDAADLTFREQVSPTGALVRLGDVADITCDDPTEADRLSTLPLMPAPAPGTRTMITAQGVRELIVASGVDLNSLRFSGAIRIVVGDQTKVIEPPPAKRTFVEPEPIAPSRNHRNQTGFRARTSSSRPRQVTLGSSVTEKLTAQVQASIVEFARRELNEALVEAHTSEIAPRQLQLLSGATTPLRVTTTSPVSVGRQRFLVSFSSPAGEVRFPVFADVRPARPAVFVVRSVPRGAMITRADVELRAMPFDARLRADEVAFEAIEDVIGREANRAFRPDTLLTDANCLPPMMVRRGEQVSVVSSGGGISIRMTAKARANGRLGEIIAVETFDTREQLSARVVGRRELAVLPTVAGANDYLTTAARERNAR